MNWYSSGSIHRIRVCSLGWSLANSARGDFSVILVNSASETENSVTVHNPFVRSTAECRWPTVWPIVN